MWQIKLEINSPNLDNSPCSTCKSFNSLKIAGTFFGECYKAIDAGQTELEIPFPYVIECSEYEEDANLKS
jgi:hypothetical protein